MDFDIRQYGAVTSTMDVARAAAEQGAAEGLVVVADEQTAGRGRSNHTWYSPPGQSLYVSILLRPPLAPAYAGWITMVAALGIRDLITNYQLPISIKWFNDVLLSGRKVCGILVETSLTAGQLDYAVLGIGLNVNTRFFDAAPQEVRARATSLLDERRRRHGDAALPFEREALLPRLLAHFAERYAGLLRAGASPARDYTQYVETLGRDVRVDTGSGMIVGRATRIADDGALIVQTAAGEQRIGFGDVI